jgi:ribonuclease PH
MLRPSKRKFDELRDIDIQLGVNKYAEGSCIICCGNTQVICTATVEDKVPQFIRGKYEGWVTAEYSMLPRSTGVRVVRDRDRVNSRALEIQRLIGRSLRMCVDMKKLGIRQILVDCDVIQADGGTRCASITGGFVAMYMAIDKMIRRNILPENPIISFVSAVSCGIWGDSCILDLDYEEDSNSSVDVNFAMDDSSNIIEIQGTAEKSPFSFTKFTDLFALAVKGNGELVAKQKEVLELR